MAWPPPIPPHRTNATPSIDTHPGDHNQIADALTELVNRANAGVAVWRVGSVTVAFAAGAGTLTLPNPFPTTCAGAIVQLNAGSLGPGNALCIVAANPASKSTIALVYNNTGTLSLPVFFIAWGT